MECKRREVWAAEQAKVLSLHVKLLPFTDRLARQRMAVLVMSTMLFTMVDAAFDVVGPLWTTRELGLTNSGWAYLRSTRFLGTFLGIVVFGFLVERIGSRRMSGLALGCAGLALAGMSLGVPVGWMIPIYGALVCTTYVNLNVLTQRVSSAQQGLANVIYRAAGAAAVIAAPILATQGGHAAGSYAPVLMIAALLLVVAGFLILFYPDAHLARGPKATAGVVNGYRKAFALRPLLALIALAQIFAGTAAPVVAFSALRFTRQLHLSDPVFGVICTTIAGVSLLGIISSSWLMQRLRPSRLLGFCWLGCSLAAVALGLSDSLTVAIMAYAVHVPLMAMRSVPESLWVSRIADAAGPDGPSQAMVFTVQKICQAGTNVLMMALVGVLEPHFGIAKLMFGCGVLGLPLAIAVIRLGKTQELNQEVRF